MAFLGHIFSGKGTIVDTHNINAHQSWPKAKSPTYIRSFFGLTDNYRRFVDWFSSTSSPLTKLTQKTITFKWSEACDKSFQEFKKRLLPLWFWPYQRVLKALCCIVMHQELDWVFYWYRMARSYYASGHLKVHEYNYSTHDLESAVRWRSDLGSWGGNQVEISTSFESVDKADKVPKFSF